MDHEVPHGSTPGERAALGRMHRMSYVFDDMFTIPFLGIDFGIDPVIGLIPVLGDAVAFLTTGYLFVEAYLLGLPRWLYARMLFNLAVDFAFGSIPVLGLVVDVLWKANDRNVVLIEGCLYDRVRRRQQVIDRRRRLPSGDP